MNNIDSHSIEWELIMFIKIRVLRLHSTDWKSSLIGSNLLKVLFCFCTNKAGFNLFGGWIHCELGRD